MENKKIISRVFDEVMNQRKFDLVDQLFDTNFRHGMPGTKPGPAGFKEILNQFMSGFPDMKIDLQTIIGEGDWVATRGTWTGTHKGNFMNIPATNKKVNVEFIDIWKFSNGKISQNWVQMDMPALMVQIGAMQPV